MILNANWSGVSLASENDADKACLRGLFSLIKPEDKNDSPGEDARAFITEDRGSVKLTFLTGE